MIRIRLAQPDDAPLLLELIKGLAEYEKLSDQVSATAQDLRDTLFGARPAAEALIAELDGAPAGFALFFSNYSTFLAKPGIYLEDLFVRPEARGHGAGRALLGHLAKLAVARNCGRLEWAVLDWNEPAIDFYEKLGATPRSAWTTYRLTGDALRALARSAG